ncbi:DUF411 domain-containing protein [Mycobacterium tuberculosis]|jgi:hypothetical protein|uniref:DUF411 domain-containing protein n=1 Tax=unclassified Variovorax TaxID=663243 RepID=UPI000E28A909|nr:MULTISPECIES: DUF411 domain-containing protein [unclassified Variovorax]REM66905.1 DUF411 domain-containing protein [Mycobacterium tuberculosis]REN20356.1 DUF411 domain-containing protein [Mycobacterium tuberculosis]RSZ29537.1 DUF411 domain-containing protein [Variovorax sp. 553]RSZ30132.1 DUF411 domain-containing protein [Variovorax sp. 679]
MNPLRRRFSAATAIALALQPMWARATSPAVEVWRGRGCLCCEAWVRHLERGGFDVMVHDGGNAEARARLGMPLKYRACHTASAAGYVLEGHVPLREIQRLLHERPDAIGLAVAGMPRGSPGMDGPAYRGKRDPFNVLLVHKDASTTIYQSYQ